MNARVAVVLVFLAAVAAILFFSTRGGGGGDPSTGAGGTPSSGPAADAVEVTMLYSTEKKDWIEAAAQSFKVEHPDIKLTLRGMGSLQSAEAILDGREKPVLWSPADSLILNLLVSDWDARYHTTLVDIAGQDKPDPLLITPLVFVAWEDRANVLLKASGGTISWKSIAAAVSSNQGWPAIGGKAEWGFVKLGHTDPTQSNSGLQALLLMTMEHYNKTTGLTVADILNPEYQAFIAGIEKGVAKFEPSTGTFMTDMVRFGPSKYDIAAVYEGVAISQIENAQGRWGNLRVYYPATTIWSDHPAALLQGDWVTDAQKAAARTWLQYLRSPPIQQRALAMGFRPASPEVPIQSSDPSNPFVKYSAYGVQVEIPPVANPPDGTVVRNLLTMWSRVVKP